MTEFTASSDFILFILFNLVYVFMITLISG